MKPASPTCIVCKKKPQEIEEYRAAAECEHPRMTPDEYVRREEGTYNRETNQFTCTECYMDLGMPSAPTVRGWIAGDEVPR